jgi:uncharacterized membrane protein YagU involved in acid resistance
MTNPLREQMQPSPAETIGVGGLIAGVLDITDAIVFYYLRGVSPRTILQSIASGLLGADAFQGGTFTAALGLLLHFVIAFAAAAVFYLASVRVRALWRHPFIAGAAYGLVVYAVMNHIVLPLSAFNTRPLQINAVFFNLIFAHIVCVGWPIALAAHRSARVPTRARPGHI